jgi:hypothetical protein
VGGTAGALYPSFERFAVEVVLASASVRLAYEMMGRAVERGLDRRQLEALPLKQPMRLSAIVLLSEGPKHYSPFVHTTTG